MTFYVIRSSIEATVSADGRNYVLTDAPNKAIPAALFEALFTVGPESGPIQKPNTIPTEEEQQKFRGR